MSHAKRIAFLLAAWILLAAPVLAQPNTACGNGDFESGLSASEWSGGNGVVLRNGDPHFASFAAGLLPGMANGDLNAKSSHQTWVDAKELDPIIGSRVAPGCSTHAVRIGNTVSDARADMLAKTFVVTSERSVIRFSYAAVLEQGADHSNAQQSSFWVRVLDASGAPILGAVHLVGSADKLVAGDSSLVPKPGTCVFYRDWTRASIDLSPYVGQTVTVQLITEDCSLGGHYAYAYVDDFCDTDCGGRLGTVTVTPSTDCGKVDVCVDYTLPDVAGCPGSVVLRLDILQDGPIASISSPVLTSGTGKCFTIDPQTLPLSPERTFKFAVTGTFSVGGVVCNVETVGPVAEHHVDCPDCNLIANGDFEAGNSGFTSAYTATPMPVRPGQYAVLNAAGAAAVARTWRAASHPACDAEGRFLVVNGATGKDSDLSPPLSDKKLAWSQTVPVIEGKEYRFSANFRGLPACGFDVRPEVELRFSSPPDDIRPFVVDTMCDITPCDDTTPDDTACDPCHWQMESGIIHIPVGVATLTCEIWLDETAAGDGNDLAIDDISLVCLP